MSDESVEKVAESVGEDENVDIDLSDTPTPAVIAASAPAPTGLAGTGIISPLAALQKPAETSSGGGGGVAGTVRRGRGSSAGGSGYLSQFINCDFEPDKPDSPWNFSSKVWNGQAEPGIASDPTYYKAYKTELQVVDDTKVQFGIRWQGNGKIGRWTAPFSKGDGTIGERIIEAVNPPASVIEVREQMATSEEKARQRALAHGVQTATAKTAGGGGTKGIPAPHQMQLLEFLGDPDSSTDLDVDLSDVGPKAAPPPPAVRQPKAQIGAPAKPAAQPAPPEEVLSLEDALAAANVGTEEAAPPTTAPNDFGEPPLEVFAAPALIKADEAQPNEEAAAEAGEPGSIEQLVESVLASAETNGEGPPFLEGREAQFGLNEDGTPTEELKEEMAAPEQAPEPAAAGSGGGKRTSKRRK